MVVANPASPPSRTRAADASRADSLLDARSRALPSGYDPRVPAGIGARLRRYYFAGVVVLAPTALTLWVVWQLFSFFDSILGRQLRARGISVFGLGFLLLNALILLLGWLA